MCKIYISFLSFTPTKKHAPYVKYRHYYLDRKTKCTHTTKNTALIRDGGGREMKMVPISNIASTTGIEKQNTHTHTHTHTHTQWKGHVRVFLSTGAGGSGAMDGATVGLEYLAPEVRNPTHGRSSACSGRCRSPRCCPGNLTRPRCHVSVLWAGVISQHRAIFIGYYFYMDLYGSNITRCWREW